MAHTTSCVRLSHGSPRAGTRNEWKAEGHSHEAAPHDRTSPSELTTERFFSELVESGREVVVT
jgi:hypothetical protein